MYLAQGNNLESFVQVGYDAFDTGDNGITAEPNLQLPAHTSNSNPIAKEPTIQKHVDEFIDRASRLEVKDSVFLHSCLKLNRFLVVSQISSSRLSLDVVALGISYHSDIRLVHHTDFDQRQNANANDLQSRLDLRGDTQHLDYIEQLKELYHIQHVAVKLFLASWQPLANQFYTIILLLKNPDTYVPLVSEVRTVFSSNAVITIGSHSSDKLRYLQACLTSQIGYFSSTGSPRFFHKPFQLRPERWLSPDHPSLKPFSQGLRGCPGGSLLMAIIRPIIAKVIWRSNIKRINHTDISLDRNFEFVTFWERPEFLVRMKTVQISCDQ
ncbi:cytochrome P450 [Xylariaceae sp. FL1019]|nr:cytochrome P450 [Xylariaceae sp. FL1019]